MKFATKFTSILAIETALGFQYGTDFLAACIIPTVLLCFIFRSKMQ
jgi:hypothetical protein